MNNGPSPTTKIRLPASLSMADLYQHKNSYLMCLPDIIQNIKDNETEQQYFTSINNKALKYPIMICNNGELVAIDKQSLLGRGAFGNVYVGQNLNTGKFVAIKEHFTNEEEQVSEADAEINSLIEHDRFVGQCFYDDYLYIVQPLAYGKNYHKTLFCDDVMPDLQERIDMAIAAVKTIKSFIEQGYLHRDLKLENIIWDPLEKEALLVDLAKTVYAQEYDHKIDGTPKYMAPELWRANPYHSARSEIYALGMMILEILCGHEFNKDTMFFYCKHKPTEGLAQIIVDAFPEVFKDKSFGNKQNDVIKIATSTLDADPNKRSSFDEILTMLEKLSLKHAMETMTIQPSPIVFRKRPAQRKSWHDCKLELQMTDSLESDNDRVRLISSR